ncbi:beta-1,4-N-acetylgalactosaminyltransferase 3 [Genypterus blacodes]|uniref:beta-1,4-N-acetylgalactosaminyltransferase 3 n=1 Tax=Genypterus blacodes TaxID=154954 RepID=UPI003F7766CB
MIAAVFPLKKLRRNGKHVLFGVILLAGALAVYHEIVATKARIDGAHLPSDVSSWRKTMSDQMLRREDQQNVLNNSAAWSTTHTPQPWKPEYKGQANLHVFEDWCGSSTADLRMNLHYPLYPHFRTTVQKLAVSPQWTNYGLRIFGYLHPYTDGEFVFAVSSDDNSEFWLSKDDTPLNLQILAWVGKTGTEWTAPGEFEKYASQTSRPVRLSAQRRYFFEVIHKQDHKGTDHVEVAWQLLDNSFRFTIIESKYISLYVNESALLMSDVAHIPQTAASHKHTPTKHEDAADMLREDPRDSFYKVPLVHSKFLQEVLPHCTYRPSYIIKDFPLLRYQGLQFVHLSYVYPNDYTRLTHMETENSCFYPEKSYYRKMFGFSRYMKLDHQSERVREVPHGGARVRHRIKHQEEEDDDDDEGAYKEGGLRRDKRMSNGLFQDYGDDFDDYALKRKRKLFSVTPEAENMLKKSSDARLHEGVLQPQSEIQKPAELQQSLPTNASKHLPLQDQNQAEMLDKKVEGIKPRGKLTAVKRQKVKSVKTTNPSALLQKEQPEAKGRAVLSQQRQPKKPYVQRSRKKNNGQIQRVRVVQSQPLDRNVPMTKEAIVANQQRYVTRAMELQPAVTRHFTSQPPSARRNQRVTASRKKLREKEIQMNMPLQKDRDNIVRRGKVIVKNEPVDTWPDDRGGENQQGMENEMDHRIEKQWGLHTPAPVFDTAVKWNQTFRINHLDLQTERTDWIELHCNVSGNLLLHPSDAQPMVDSFMAKLNRKHDGRFTLVRVVNVVKRVDGIQGSRYLLELELKDEVDGNLVRLSHYIYALILHSGRHNRDIDSQRQKPQLVLCNPKGFRWNTDAMVNIIVPVKNQARWVHQLIADVEELYRQTGDTNFNLIIADYSSTDMDVEKALRTSSLHRYQYVKLTGNFQRSAGLQAGVNLISDDHSIVFLCDLHIYFPPSIIDSMRKHCVEGYMAFAPIVMRLDCGATSSKARGYWEVNGFGLLGIYKSDLDAVGGMNTKDFTERWGGEDWELLDRILQAGLEVDRIYLRNFFHHYHTKRGMWNRRLS